MGNWLYERAFALFDPPALLLMLLLTEAPAMSSFCSEDELRAALVRKVAALAVVEGAVDAFAAPELRQRLRSALGHARHDDLAELARRDPASADWKASLAALLIDADARLPPD